jgi:hypothetical protein
MKSFSEHRAAPPLRRVREKPPVNHPQAGLRFSPRINPFSRTVPVLAKRLKSAEFRPFSQNMLNR